MTVLLTAPVNLCPSCYIAVTHSIVLALHPHGLGHHFKRSRKVLCLPLPFSTYYAGAHHLHVLIPSHIYSLIIYNPHSTNLHTYHAQTSPQRVFYSILSARILLHIREVASTTQSEGAHIIPDSNSSLPRRSRPEPNSSGYTPASRAHCLRGVNSSRKFSRKAVGNDNGIHTSSVGELQGAQVEGEGVRTAKGRSMVMTEMETYTSTGEDRAF